MSVSLGKGFTLIELLVVIAILAVLATVVVIVLNPAELLKQSRDSSRISDIAAVNSAVALYIADVASPDLDASNPNSFSCGAGSAPSTPSCTLSAATTPLGTGGSSRTCATITTTASSSLVSGVGWVPIVFTNISSGSPLPKLPIDPINSGLFFYAYSCDSTNLTYELTARMESTKYATTSASEIVSQAKDGGNANFLYEVGNDPGLDLLN